MRGGGSRAAGIAARASTVEVKTVDRILRYPGGEERRLTYIADASSPAASASEGPVVEASSGAATARAWIAAWRTRSLEQCLEPQGQAAEARAWIEAWRSKSQSQGQAAEVRAWIYAWRSKPQPNGQAAEARAWIEAWRSKRQAEPDASVASVGLSTAGVFGTWLEEEGVITFSAEQLNAICLDSALAALAKKC